MSALPRDAIQDRIDRARHKALDEARHGNLPTLLRSEDSPHETRRRYAVGSRTERGRIWLIDLVADIDGISTHCGCETGQRGGICWHRAACRMAALGELASHDGRTRAADRCRHCGDTASLDADPDGLCRRCRAAAEGEPGCCPGCGQIGVQLVAGRCQDCLNHEREMLFGQPRRERRG